MIRLQAAGVDNLVIDDWANGINCSQLDIGWPSVRAVSENRPGSDGTIDETKFMGARAVTVRLDVTAGENGSTRRSNLDLISRFCHPGLRPRIVWVDPTGGYERGIDLRADQGSAPFTSSQHSTIQVSWVAPAGVITSEGWMAVDIYPSSDVPGRTYPLTFPRVYPSSVGGPETVVNAGTISAEWTARIYGPVTGPVLENVSTGEWIGFPGLTIASGDYLALNSANRTAVLNDVASASRYSYFDFAGSTWWRLAPGSSLVDFSASSAVSPAMVWFEWSDTYLL